MLLFSFEKWNRMWLRNHDDYQDLLNIDVIRDARERFRSTNNDIVCSGFFFEHDNSLFALGAEFGNIYVILDGKLLKHDNSLQTQLNESPDFNTFTATHGVNMLCRVTYTPIKASGWIPNEDDECLDGFLWIHNVLRSSERMTQIALPTAGSSSNKPVC